MKEYFVVLMGVCVISAIVRVVSPNDTSKKYVEIICSLCVVSAMVLPLLDLLGEAEDFELVFETGELQSEDYQNIYEGYVLEKGIEMAQNTFSRELEGVFGVDSGSMQVSFLAETSENHAVIVGATVTLGPASVAVAPEKIRGYVQERLGVECEIIYKLID